MVRLFKDITNEIGLTEKDQYAFLNKTNQLIAKILLNTQSKIQNNYINKGITKSSATCFLFLFIGFVIMDNLLSFICEINEFPFSNEK